MSRHLADLPTSEWLNNPTPKLAAEIVQFLTERGTFRFPALSSGLFSAAAFEQHEPEATGYGNVWTRDAVQIIEALRQVESFHSHGTGAANPQRALEALCQFYIRSRHRFAAIIDDPSLAADPMQRPHIRFHGETLEELPEKWSHAQNDALGYWLWLTSRAVYAEEIALSPELAETMALLVRYFAAIEYWTDADSGHWEEVRKVSASSIGVALAGLKSFLNVLELNGELFLHSDELLLLVGNLIDAGTAALNQILPHECIEGDATQVRPHDAALLFLIYPLGTITGRMVDQVVENVQTHLMGPIGIRRYNGDSYWCANYKQLLSADVRTSDFSDDQESRDKLLVPGTEAQWCIFDPILSIIYARRYLELGNPKDHEQQLVHLRRSLAQLTDKNSRFGPYRCPESYYLEGETWVPNDITPLLWTQANLRLALYWLEQVLTA